MNTSNNKEDAANCSYFGTDEYRKARRGITFPIFTRSTDAKDYTVNVSSVFLDGYLPSLITNLSCNVVDLGVGDGELTYKVAKYMNGTCKTKMIDLEGIDSKPDFVNKTQSRLSTLDYVNGTIILGDCFSDEINQLANNSVLLIASHVIYYLGNVTISEFIQKTLNKTGLVSIIIAQATGSVLNSFSSAYSHSNKVSSTEAAVENELKMHNVSFNHIKILYSSYIFFPAGIDYNKLVRLATDDFDNLKEEDYNTRGLLEFIAGAPLEYLICLDRQHSTTHLYDLIADIDSHLSLNNGKIKYWSYMTITVPVGNMNQEEMYIILKEIYRHKFSGNETAFLSAFTEGNLEIIDSLHRQGHVTCDLINYKFEDSNEAKEKFYSYIRYSLRQEPLYTEFFRYVFGEELDERKEFREYRSLEMHRMQAQQMKYNYTVKYGVANESKKQNPEFTTEGKVYRDCLANKTTELFGNGYLSFLVSYPLIFEFLTSSILVMSTFISSHIAQLEQVIGLNLMFFSFHNRFFFTSSSAIHYIKGDDILLQFYLYEEKNINSLKYQNSEGQTALHVAISQNDLQKVDNLLSCGNSVVQNIINTKDSRGTLPIHYASVNGNQKILKYLVDKGANHNLKAEVNLFNLVSDSLFLIGKLTYLYGYFVTSVGRPDQPKIQMQVLLGVTYGCAKYLNMKFPDYIYYQTFLHRLNPFDNCKILEKIDQIYEGYSYDTALHLSTKYNYTDISKYLIATDALVDVLNAKGESILHLAAANDNLEILDLLIENNANINQQNKGGKFFPVVDLLFNLFNSKYSLPSVYWNWDLYLIPNIMISTYNLAFDFVKNIADTKIHLYHNLKNYQFYPVADFLAKAIIVYYGPNQFNRFFAEILFLKIIHDEMFGSFHAVHLATPLHYAVAGMKLSDLRLDSNEIMDKEVINNETITKLLENGADPDLSMSYYSSLNEQLLPFILTKGLTCFFPFLHYYRMPILLLNQFLFPYNKEGLKAIDLIENNNQVYKYLKQYTAMNDYSNLDDEIHMTKFGMYKGGEGKNVFHIYTNITDQENRSRVIIKDYKIHEDELQFYGCNSSITHEEKIFMKHNVTIFYCDETELVTLWGVESKMFGEGAYEASDVALLEQIIN